MIHQTKNTISKHTMTLAVAGIMSLASLASAATVDQVVDKHIEASGGRTAQEAVTSLIQKSSGTLVDFGMDFDLVIYAKDENFKQVVEIPGMGTSSEGITGDIAWRVDPMQGTAILEGAEAAAMREQASFDSFLDWKETYASAEVTGEENGATIVVFKSHDGRETTCHFDNASGLLTKQAGTDPAGNAFTSMFSDYKMVSDLNIAHKVVIESVQANIEISVSSTELNPEIDEAVFELPDVIKALLPAAN